LSFLGHGLKSVMDVVVTSHRLTGHPHSIQSSVILSTESITTNLVNSRNHGSCRTHIITQGLCALFTNVHTLLQVWSTWSQWWHPSLCSVTFRQK